MNRTVGELIALAGVSGLSCGIAFAFDYVIATATFAVMTCSIGALAVTVGRRS